MIARTWGGRGPIAHAIGFHRHHHTTGVAHYWRQPMGALVEMEMIARIQ